MGRLATRRGSFALLGLGAAVACTAHDRVDGNTRATSAAIDTVSDSLLTDVQTRYRVARSDDVAATLPLLRDGAAASVALSNGAYHASFSRSPSAATDAPTTADAAIHITDAKSGVAASFSLNGATAASAALVRNVLVYRSALAGADVFVRPAVDGVEDWLLLSTAGTTSLSYSIGLGDGVAGLRLVNDTLEFVDAHGAPRLRVSPPLVEDASGHRRWATLSVTGCATDTEPHAVPWGRPPTPPGASTCTLHVAFDATGLTFPVLVDPSWTSTSQSMSLARRFHGAARLANGRVLVSGSDAATSFSDATITYSEQYDPRSGTWSSPGWSGGSQFSGNVTAVVGNGDAITAGGGEPTQTQSVPAAVNRAYDCADLREAVPCAT